MQSFYVVTIMFSLFLIICGGLIWRFKMVDIIAGYDSTKVSDPQGLAKCVGSNVLLMGLSMLLSALVFNFVEIDKIYHIIGVFLIITLLVIRILISAKRF